MSENAKKKRKKEYICYEWKINKSIKSNFDEKKIILKAHGTWLKCVFSCFCIYFSTTRSSS